MLTPLSHRSYWELFDYSRPRNDHFHPLPHLLSQPFSLAQLGGITPLPDSREVLLSTPAWDPSSRTPGWTPRWLSSPQPPESGSSVVPLASASTSADPHALTKQAAPIEHVLFDPRLLGIKIKVKFMGGIYENKEVDITPSIVNGQPVFPFKHYKIRINYPPEWVSVVLPNTKQDEGLLVVIKGKHCGKLIHRVHF